MLTRHEYSPFREDITNKDSSIYKCCRTNDPGEPKCTDCCYDDWQDKLKEIISDYSREEEKAVQAKKKFDFASEKSQRYRTWLDELTKAEEFARAICHQLDIIASQSERIWYNSVQAEDAVEILFCMIRDFFMQVDCIRKRYDVLWTCITSNNDPSVQARDKGIIKCLTEYLKRLEDVIKARDEIIKAIVEAIRISKLIRYSISTKEYKTDYKPCEGDKGCDCCSKEITYGFKAIICDWYCDFYCDVKCKPCSDNKSSQRSSDCLPPSQPPSPPPLCSATICELEPVFEFPFCNNPYKCDLEECLRKAEDDAQKASDCLLIANKNKEALSACKEGLKKAIAEADPKVRCK